MPQKAKQLKLLENAQTTAQQLGALIKSARDIMRKDKGLNGELDRIPMLTWIMFLKFLDDMEHIRESEAELGGEDFRALIAPPYRWRDWAADEGGITGPDLINFINLEEANRPDGTKGPGLFHYLRNLRSTDGKGRQEVIATVFRGLINRMQSGFLLRDVVNKVNSIHFDASEEMHTLSRFYETMLKEMRDAAGDSGEFYTPRPVVKFIVAATNLQLGETVLDPASGTGGFLVETLTHLEKKCQTIADRQSLQESTIYGLEAKPMPYLLCQMNLLLHGLENPQIHFANALTIKRYNEIGDNDRYDVILTNPPFSGEEEVSVKSYFPPDMQTIETALLFLQIIMRRLKRPERNKGKAGRAAVVVPNGVLFEDGVCARIKEELLTNFNLHTIIRLPDGVFEPYTEIPTNILFFDCTRPTKEIWFYEIPLPEGKKKYTKTKPMKFEEFSECTSWFHPIAERQENEYAWKVNVEDVLKYDEEGKVASAYLDIKNPNSAEGLVHLSSRKIADGIVHKDQKMLELLEKIKGESLAEFLEDITKIAKWKKVRLSEILTERKETPDPVALATGEVRIVSKIGFNTGEIEFRDSTATKTKMIQFQPGDIVFSGINAVKGAIAIYPNNEEKPASATIHYSAYTVNPERADVTFLWGLFRSKAFQHNLFQSLPGGIKTELKPEHLLSISVKLPSLLEQRRIREKINSYLTKLDEICVLSGQLEIELSAFVSSLAMFKGKN